MLKKSLIGLLMLPTLSHAIELSGALTGFYLTTSADDVNSEFIGVLDADIEGQLPIGRWHMYVEGTSSSKAGKVTATYGEALADAGGAADEDGDGRIQISSLEYYLPLGKGELVAGLLYPSGFTESGDWSNDETTQFISSAFVNIQTSGAPDYALGLGYTGQIDEQLSYSFLLSQAQGLGDLDARYSTLFDELDEYFTSAELVWQYQQLTIHGALWISSLDIEAFDGGMDNNAGGHLTLAYQTDVGQFLFRYGLANEDVSEIDAFYGVSWQQQVDRWAFGLGYSQSMVSSELNTNNELDDISQFEAYAKYQVLDNVHLTGSIQHIENSGFGDLGEIETEPTIVTLRASFEF
ncbi:hypothetical protein DXX93_14260 [Thalassotalea euphylliae]|uniref:Porin n=1 Tax=Thalassotalea euphylliae TaxID=1655234 RepID=A0A3E0TUK7_9GAMM|nr:hypothetical protein [Thalassotalea euphylliae]REL27605.1 hypothetical protein DXX93_14260 [Thalassotalea euphylliae]